MDPLIPSSTLSSSHQPGQPKVRSSVSQTYGYGQPGADLDAQGQRSHKGAEQIGPETSAQDANFTEVPGQYAAGWGPEDEQRYEQWEDCVEQPPLSPKSQAIFQLALSVRKSYEPSLPNTTTCQFSGAVKEGSFNSCNTILFSDGVKWILKRLQHIDEHTWSLDKQRQTDNTFNIMMHIRQVTSVPVPVVYMWSSSFQNALGSPYVLEQLAEGQTVSEALDELDGDGDAQGLLLTRTTLELGGYLKQLRDCASFDKIGTPVYRHGQNLGVAHTYTPWSQFAGPFDTASDHLFHQFEFEQQGRGPTCEGVFLRLFMNWLEQVSKDEKTFTLYHPDCNIANILVDRSGRITAIIDWDFVQTGPSYLSYPAFPRLICSDWYRHDQGEFNNLRAKVEPTRCCTGIGHMSARLPEATELVSRHGPWDRMRLIWEESCRSRDADDKQTRLDQPSDKLVAWWWRKSGDAINTELRRAYSFSGLFLQNIAEGCFLSPAGGIVTHILAHMVVQDRQSRLGEILGYGPLMNVRNLLKQLNAGALTGQQMCLIKEHFYRMLYYPAGGKATAWTEREMEHDHLLLREVDYLIKNSSNDVHPWRPMLQRHKIDYAALKSDAVRARWKAAAHSRTRQAYISIGKKFSVVLPQNEIAQALRKRFGHPKACCRAAKNRLMKDMRGRPRPRALSPEKVVMQEYLIQMLWLVKHDRQLQNLVFGKVVYKPATEVGAAEQTPPHQSERLSSKAAKTVPDTQDEVSAKPSVEEPVHRERRSQEEIKDLKRALAEQKQHNEELEMRLAKQTQMLERFLGARETRLPAKTGQQNSAQQTDPRVDGEGDADDAIARTGEKQSSEAATSPDLDDSGYATGSAAYVDAQQEVTKGAEAEEASTSKLVEQLGVNAEASPRPTSAHTEPRHDALSSSESSSFVDAVEYLDELPQASDPQDGIEASRAQMSAPNLLADNTAAPQLGPLQPEPAGLTPAPARSIFAHVSGWFRGWGHWLRNLPDTDTGGGEIDRLLNGEFN
ncbi:MAG: hypothetical protein Q9162_002312 [Coniocarpon cinnabarinum]